MVMTTKWLAVALSLISQPVHNPNSNSLHYSKMTQSYCTTKSDGTRRIQKVEGKTCPSGYFSTGDCCEAFKDAKDAIPKIDGKSCPSGTYASGGSCVNLR